MFDWFTHRARALLFIMTPASVHLSNKATFLRVRIVVTLYLTYLCYYLARKADAISKSQLKSRAGFTLDDLAMADTCYLFTYTFALFGSGMLGSRVPSNVMLCVGLMGVAGVSFLKANTTSPSFYSFLQVLHAVFQSSGWPTCIKVLAAWVTHNRGTIMGLWTTCQSFGGVFGALAATWFATQYGWESSYLYHVPILLGMAVTVLFIVQDEPPHELSRWFTPAGEDVKKGANESAVTPPSPAGFSPPPPAPPPPAPPSLPPTSSSSTSISIRDVVALPGVLAVGTSYFFLKFMRYALLFWLPYYYEHSLGYDSATAGYLSTSFEFGGALGTPLIGYISDQYIKGKRDLAAALFMLGSCLSLTGCILLSAEGPSVNAFLMGATGILVIGPDSVLSGTIAQDIGQRSGLGKSAVGSVAGLLNSMGSAGSIFQSGATAYISTAFGWGALFSLFVACSFASSMILFKVWNDGRAGEK